ncbi:MAG: efflux RND transporter periplasmic adaptor subunit [Flavobacteriaceae bacterium]|nr:efflux RND transporter periplasmic adaptor subunit [Flavobacteriaceae bacterium]
MKRLIYIGLLLGLVVGCGEKREQKSIERLIAKKDIEGLQRKQSELQNEYNALTQKMAQINTALADLKGTKQLPIVTTVRAKQGVFERTIEMQGSVDTKNNTMLYSEFSGMLKNLYVRKGQRVRKGQIIAKVDDGGLSQKLAQMQVQYNLAKTSFERQERLWKKKIGSEIQYLQAKAQKEASESGIKQLKAQLRKTTIVAPFSGIIDDVPVKKGSVVMPGQTPIARLVNLSDMYVRSQVSERYLPTIKVGTPVQIHFPAIGKTLTSKVRQVGNFINPNNRTFYIEIGISNKDNTIKPNLMATLKIADYRNENAVSVPVNIVQEDGEGNSFVFAINEKNGKYFVEKMPIEKGVSQDGFVEITKGISADAMLVAEGSQGIQNGAEVQLKKN